MGYHTRRAIKLQANVVRNGEGKKLEIGPAKMCVKEDGTHTRNSISFIETEVLPNFQVPPQHIHRGYEELFYVLDGEVEFIVEEEVVIGYAGDVVIIPEGVRHTYRNSSEKSARLLILHTDGRMSKFFEETETMMKKGYPAAQVFTELMPKYNMDPVPSK